MSVLQSGLDDVIADTELLGRFLTSSGLFAKTTGRVKYPAFLPDKIDDETSVFRVDGLDEIQVSQIGISNLPGGRFHGVAVVKALFAKQRLEVTPDEPPGRHGVFRNWPTDTDPEEQKSKRMSIAQEIAEEAKFLPKVDSESKQ